MFISIKMPNKRLVCVCVCLCSMCSVCYASMVMVGVMKETGYGENIGFNVLSALDRNERTDNSGPLVMNTYERSAHTRHWKTVIRIMNVSYTTTNILSLSLSFSFCSVDPSRLSLVFRRKFLMGKFCLQAFSLNYLVCFFAVFIFFVFFTKIRRWKLPLSTLNINRTQPHTQRHTFLHCVYCSVLECKSASPSSRNSLAVACR